MIATAIEVTAVAVALAAVVYGAERLTVGVIAHRRIVKQLKANGLPATHENVRAVRAALERERRLRAGTLEDPTVEELERELERLEEEEIELGRKLQKEQEAKAA